MKKRVTDVLKPPRLPSKLVPSTESTPGLASIVKVQTNVPQVNNITFAMSPNLTRIGALDPPHFTSNVSSSILPSNMPIPLLPCYKASTHRPHLLYNMRRSYFMNQAQSQCTLNLDRYDFTKGTPLPYLKDLVRNRRYPDATNLIKRLLQDQDTNSGLGQLPPGIPPIFAPEFMIHGIRAGATEQCLQIYDLAATQIGAPPSSQLKSLNPPTSAQLLFYGNYEMTLALVRHLVKFSEKRPNQLRGWYKASLKANPKFFLEHAERVYSAYAAVHGFDDPNSEKHEPRPDAKLTDPREGVTIACLFELGRCEVALDIFSSLFDRWARQHAHVEDGGSSRDGTNPTAEHNQPTPLDVLSCHLNQPGRPNLYSLELVFPSLARQDLDYSTLFLLELAPARLAGFQPSSYLYVTVIQQLLERQKFDEAFRVLEHANGAECKDFKLGTEAFNKFVRAKLKNITEGWERDSAGSGHYMASDELEAMVAKRSHGFTHILKAFDFLGKRANVSTVHEAINTALDVGCPGVAREIRAWGRSVGVFKKGKKRSRALSVAGNQEEQVLESTPQTVAQALVDLHRRGFMDSVELEAELDKLGVEVENGAPAPTA